MNYTVFDQLREGAFAPEEGEPEQQHMERVFRAVFHTGDAEAPANINSMLCGAFADCDALQRSLTVGFRGEKWMCNPNGTIHGGIMATAADMTMGILARFYRKERKVVTTNLTISFMRPLPADGRFEVRAVAEKAGARMVFMKADILNGSTKEMAASVQAVFV